MEELSQHTTITTLKNLFKSASSLSQKIEWEVPCDSSDLCNTCSVKLSHLDSMDRKIVFEHHIEKPKKQAFNTLKSKVSGIIQAIKLL
jgi:ferredoxin